MNNLEKITAAWQIRWSATIKDTSCPSRESYQVVGVIKGHGSSYLLFLHRDEIFTFSPERIKQDLEIIGYKYAGELAGCEPIPKGQKFLYKKDGVILTFDRETWEGVKLKVKPFAKDLFLKSEIEPYFN